MPSVSSLDLLARWREHADQQAIAELVARYRDRLLALARRRLAPALGRRLDADDAVQSAWRSFFRRDAQTPYPVATDAELWGLLAAIARNKVRRAVERHHDADRRSVAAERPFGSAESLHRLAPAAAAPEPTPDEAAAMDDELNHFLDRLPDDHRAVAELWLAGAGVAETADALGKSEKWVQRARRKARAALAPDTP